MAPKPMPWFRYYSETRNDVKIARVARMAGISHMEALGFWAALLSIANESPVRGGLYVTLHDCYSNDDVTAACHTDPETMKRVMAAFVALEMVTVIDGAWFITNWDKRQFISDKSSERVKKFREKERSNEDVTLHDRFRNGDVTPSETETETDTETDSLKAFPVLSEQDAGGDKKNKSERVDPAIAEMLAAWKTLFPDKPQPKAATYARQIAARMKNPAFRESWRAALEKASLSPACQAESWFCFEFVVRNDQNFQRMLDGFMDWKDREQYGAVKGNGQAARLSKSDLAAAALGIERRKDGNSNGHGQ